MLSTCLGRVRNLSEGRLPPICLEKLAFRRLVTLLKEWSGSCQSLVAKRRPKRFVPALCSADILLLQNQGGNSCTLLLSMGLPGLFTAGYFFFQTPKGLPKIQLREGNVPGDLWVLLLRRQPGERVSRHR